MPGENGPGEACKAGKKILSDTAKSRFLKKPMDFPSKNVNFAGFMKMRCEAL